MDKAGLGVLSTPHRACGRLAPISKERGAATLQKGEDGWEEHRHCTRKVRYPERSHHGSALRSYRCRFCEGWHLTHKPRSGRQRMDMNQMTPKQQYEARKAERAKLKDLDLQTRQRTEQLMTMDMLDRFVTAAERIADALERPQIAGSNLTFDQNSASGFRVANTSG